MRHLDRLLATGLCVFLMTFSISAPWAETQTLHEMPQSRGALLSFTFQPPDWSAAAFDETYLYIEQHADMVAHFMDDGIPWPEALAGARYSQRLESNIASRAAARRKGQKLLLAVNPVSSTRYELAPYFGETDGLPLPSEWQHRRWSDPEVAHAYFNYVRRLTKALRPDYLCYAFEVNSNWIERPKAEWQSFLSFLKRTHTALKAEFPDIPLVVEVVLGDDVYMQPRWQYTLPLFEVADIIAISTYPYIFDGVAANGGIVPKRWFDRLHRHANGKPLAVQETGFLAKDFLHPELGVWIPGRGKVLIASNEQLQAQYMNFLLSESERLGFTYVNWWVWQDLDKLWEKIKGHGFFADPMAAQWNHTGLRDANGTPRMAERIWDRWHRLPLR